MPFKQNYGQKVISALKRLFESLSRVFKWLPIIWKDRGFDYGYLLEIVIFKLQNMENFFKSKDAMCEGAVKRSKQIRRARKALKVFLDEDFPYEGEDYDFKKWEEVKRRSLKKALQLIEKKLEDWWD